MKSSVVCSLAALALSGAACFAQNSDIVFADFEQPDYGAWKVEGTAFGTEPAHGRIGNQMNVEGFLGHGLANSFNGGDGATGKLISPEFKIERKAISFLIGGGGWAGETCLNLIIDGKVVRTATGPNTKPGGSERLDTERWDVQDLAGKTAHLEIVDQRAGGWGHINVDQIVFTDTPPPAILANQRREIAITDSLLEFPVKTGAPKRKIEVQVNGKVERYFTIELAEGEPDWWAPLDVRAWKGQTVSVVVDKMPDNSTGLARIEQGSQPKDLAGLYQEPLRGQIHFSAQRGWLNDPNGMVYYQGAYHLFYQHNPYGWGSANKHWGHATSTDLLHWKDFGDVLYTDAMGEMYSGSAVVDWKNTSGFGQGDQPPAVLIYTAAGNPTTQCLAYTTDGQTITKYANNPVVPQFTGGNRDPKVMWYEPTQRWIMTMYVGYPSPANNDAQGKPLRRDTIRFLSSPNLKDWTTLSEIEGFYECPDFFALPLDGDKTKMKWVLTAASSDYMVGSFDGTTFKPETPKIQGHRGRGFYAAQTFSDEPKGRRIQIGWLQTQTPKMTFNQSMSLPLELTLRTTPEGPRLDWQPVAELKGLRDGAPLQIGATTLKEGDANPLAQASGELLEIHADFVPGESSEITLNVRGVPIVYNPKKQEVTVNGKLTAAAPLVNGHQRLIVYTDRTALEIFASDGLSYIPMPINLKPEERSVELSVKGTPVAVSGLEVSKLQSIWR